MKKVLISTRPQWCAKICHKIGEDETGKTIYEKRIEVRKSAPKEVPFKGFIYETQGATETPWVDEDGHFIYKGKGQVIGEFICDKVDEYKYDYGCGYYVGDGVDIDDDTLLETAIDREDINIYAKGKTLYGWHISDLKIYDKPRDLSEFYKPCPTKEKGDCLNCDCLADNDYGGICTNNLTRPPQSWQYVEDL